MNEPLLSIITPVLNGEGSLRAFLQAVVDQNCPHIEHILIDGGSQDNSMVIIEEFMGQHPHIRALSEKDNHLSEAINKGIALARGEFMTVLCLNDFYEPNTLREVVGLLPTLPQPAFLVGNCRILNEHDEVVRINTPKALTSLGIFMGREFPFNPVAYFYHKDLHRRVGLYRNCDQSDVDLLLRVLDAAKVHYVDKVWGNWRKVPDCETALLEAAGKLESGKMKILERHLASYGLPRRMFVRLVVAIDQRSNAAYYFARIRHYAQNPKDIVRVLKKMPGSERRG